VVQAAERQHDAQQQADGQHQRNVLNRAEHDELEHHAARKLPLGGAL
jgi:hypothetical protein